MRFLVVLVALVARLAALVLWPTPRLPDDARMYLGIAENVIDGWGIAYDLDGDGIPEILNEEPGYPSFLAAVLLLAGDDAVLYARLLQIALASLATLLVFDLAAQFRSPRAAVVAGFAYALHPGLVLESGTLGHEGALVPLLVLSAWLTVGSAIRRSKPWAIGTGLALGALVLVKQTTLGLPLAAAAAVCAATRGRFRWVGPGAIAAACLLMLAPWTARTLAVRSMASKLAAEAAPRLNERSPAELRNVGRRIVEHRLRGSPPARTLETITLARVAYEFYQADGRRPLWVIVAGGGEIERLVTRPLALATRVLSKAVDPRLVASVFLVPYENRFVEFLRPDSSRLKDWIGTSPRELTFGTSMKASFVLLMVSLHITAFASAALLVRQPAAWPLLAMTAYFYVMPLTSSAPQNRFFFPGISLLVVLAAFALARPRPRRLPDQLPTRPAPSRPNVVYVLPAWDPNSSEHYAHVVPFLQEVGRLVDLAVVVERASGPPPLTTPRRVAILPRGWPPLARMLAHAWCLVRLRRLGYRRIFVRISMPAALVAGTVGRALGMRSFYWNSGQGKNLAPPWGPGIAARLRRLRYEAALVPFYLATRVVHRFVTGPECMRRYYAEAYGIAERRTVVLYNDLDVDAFQRRLASHDRTDARRSLGIPEQALTVLFVGRVSPLKGGAYLLPLAERIFSKRDDTLLAVVGPIHLPEFKRAWSEHPYRDRILLLGAMANTDVVRAFAAADLFVLPSNAEGFPRVLLECMAAGLAFAAFDVGGIHEIADAAHAPFIVPRGDVDALAAAALKLLGDPALRAELGQLARLRVRRYATPRVAAMFVSRIVLERPDVEQSS